MENSLTQVEPVASPPWGRTGRYVGALILFVIGVGAFLYIRPIANTLVLALLLVAVMSRASRALSRLTHLRYSLAMIVCYLGLLLLLGLFYFRVVPWILERNLQLGAAMKPALDALLATLPPNFDLRQSLSYLATAPQPQAFLQLMATLIRSAVATMLSALLSSLQVVGFAVFVSFLMLLDLGDQNQRGLAHLPAAYRHDADRLAAATGTVWVGWLKAMVIFDLVVAAVSAVMFLLLGVPYPWLMTLVCAVVVLIPAFGGFMASLIVAVPCFLLGSTALTGIPSGAFALLIVILYNVVVNGIYYALLMPMLGKNTELPISVVLIGVLASFSIGSIWVAFVLVPLMATVRIIFDYVLAKTRDVDPFPPEPVAGGEENAHSPAPNGKAPLAA
jgi:predicted PurR-regulated permease PerM